MQTLVSTLTNLKWHILSVCLFPEIKIMVVFIVFIARMTDRDKRLLYF
jgi:hypothetical protein